MIQFSNIKTHPIVRKCDVDGPIELYCYDSQLIETEGDSVSKQCRGVAVNKHTKEIVYLGQSFVEAIPISEVTDEMAQRADCFQTIEGTMIRCFFANEKWYITTSRKLNAFSCVWGNQSADSFGSIFAQALDHFYAVNAPFQKQLEDDAPDPTASVLDKFLHFLDKSESYSFVVPSTYSCRKVCTPVDPPTVFQINRTGKSLGLPRPKKLSFTGKEAVQKYLETLNHLESPGVRIGDYSIMSNQYLRFLKARGNDPIPMKRYLALQLSEPNQQLLDDFKSLYSDVIPEFDRAYQRFIQQMVHIYTKQCIERNRDPSYIVAPELYRVFRAVQTTNEIEPKLRRCIKPTKLYYYIAQYTGVY